MSYLNSTVVTDNSYRLLSANQFLGLNILSLCRKLPLTYFWSVTMYLSMKWLFIFVDIIISVCSNFVNISTPAWSATTALCVEQAYTHSVGRMDKNRKIRLPKTCCNRLTSIFLDMQFLTLYIQRKLTDQLCAEGAWQILIGIIFSAVGITLIWIFLKWCLECFCESRGSSIIYNILWLSF